MMNKDHAISNLVDASTILSSYQVTHFLTDGTLLGFYRDNDFIAHDTDIDIGVFASEFNIPRMAAIYRAMMEKGFIMLHNFGDWETCFEATFYRHGIKVDFFFYRQKGDRYVFHAFKGRKVPEDVIEYWYPPHLVESLREIDFHGHRFMIPDETDNFLTHKYGNWRVPVTKWDWQYGPLNVVR
jgi:hypothetical protein